MDKDQQLPELDEAWNELEPEGLRCSEFGDVFIEDAVIRTFCVQRQD